MSRPLDIGQIAEMLAARAPELAQALLPLGRRQGAEWVEATTRAGGLGDSLRVHLHGAKAGVWGHFAAGRSGDALDLVTYLACADDKGMAVRWAREWLGLDGCDPAALRRSRQAAENRAKSDDADGRADVERRRGAAFRVYLDARERLAGTPAEVYLRSRGIDLAGLGRQPRALRFAPALWHGPSARHWPAIVAAVSGRDGRLCAVHRTWLAEDGRGKAPVDNAKMTLGPLAGGCVRLWRGAGGRPLSRAQPGAAVVIAEGIEDGLTVAQACPDRRVLVAVSLANMASVALPRAIGEVTICADNDAPGGPADRALARAIDAFQGQGRRVLIARSPVGKDFNDALRAAG